MKRQTQILFTGEFQKSLFWRAVDEFNGLGIDAEADQ